MNENDMSNNETSFASKIGQLVANLFVGCIATCIGACLVALTVRFIMWLF